MTAFWIAAGLLTLLVLAVLCWPLLRRRQAGHASRKAINTAIYRDQMVDIDRDLANGALTEADHAIARDELERRVLEDVADDAPTTAPRRLPRTALVLTAILPVAAVALYFVLGTPAALDPAVQQNAAPTAAEVEKMVATLAARLEQNPNNPEGWVMLGRSYKAMGRFDEAARAFDRAGPVIESEPELMLDVAELSAELNKGKIDGKGLELLQRVLKEQPDNPQALVLAGTNAFFRQNYADAVRHWERLLAMVPPDSQDAQNLSAGIDRARSLMNSGAKPTSGPFEAPAPTPEKPRAAAPANGATAVGGRVDLAPALKAKASPDDLVYIFARAAQGPRMPLAVLRARVADLPMDFKLDDSMAMSPDFKLSSAAELRIEARVSKSGDAIAKPGDLSGDISPVKPGATGLKLVIDKVLP